MIEFYLFLLLSYLLVLGLFVRQLTNKWLWFSAGYTLVMFNFVVCDFKNLLVFNFEFKSLNLGVVLVLGLLLVVTITVGHHRSTFGREIFVWLCGVVEYLNFPTSFTSVVSTVYAESDLSFWLGSLQGGSLFHDLRLLIFVVLLLTIASTYHSGEYYSYNYLVLILLATLSGVLLLANDNLVLTYLNLEFQALTLYILTTYYRFEESQTEAGLKYLLIGSLMSGFFLLGSCILYSDNASLNVSELCLPSNSTWLLATLIFKLGSAPFYFWTPSVYQVLDYTTLLFVGSLPKISTWYLLMVNFGHLQNQLLYYCGVGSILVGAYSGLYQLRLPSVIAYSGVLNSGYLLLAVDNLGEQTQFMITVYLVGYYLVLSLLLGSLYTYNTYRYTLLGGFLFYYLMLSLGGLPVVPGFSFKVYFLSFILERSLTEATLVIVSSLCSMMYYLRVSGYYLFGQPRTNQRGCSFLYQILILLLIVNLVHTLTGFIF